MYACAARQVRIASVVAQALEDLHPEFEDIPERSDSHVVCYALIIGPPRVREYVTRVAVEIYDSNRKQDSIH